MIELWIDDNRDDLSIYNFSSDYFVRNIIDNRDNIFKKSLGNKHFLAFMNKFSENELLPKKGNIYYEDGVNIHYKFSYSKHIPFVIIKFTEYSAEGTIISDKYPLSIERTINYEVSDLYIKNNIVRLNNSSLENLIISINSPLKTGVGERTEYDIVSKYNDNTDYFYKYIDPYSLFTMDIFHYSYDYDSGRIKNMASEYAFGYIVIKYLDILNKRIEKALKEWSDNNLDIVDTINGIPELKDDNEYDNEYNCKLVRILRDFISWTHYGTSDKSTHDFFVNAFVTFEGFPSICFTDYITEDDYYE